MDFRVLFVCTGNVARSPIAEHLYRAWQADGGAPGTRRVLVASAGTDALVDQPATAAALALVAHHGADASGHLARAMTPRLVDAADVVLTMTREHRAAVVRMRPAAVRRTHTVREAARVAAGVGASLPPGSPEQRWRALVPALAAGRGRFPAATGSDDDVPDPYGRGAPAYRDTAELLLPALRALVEAVTGAPGTPPPR